MVPSFALRLVKAGGRMWRFGGSEVRQRLLDRATVVSVAPGTKVIVSLLLLTRP